MTTIFFLLLLLAGSIHTGILPLFNSTCTDEIVVRYFSSLNYSFHLDSNETETSQPLVIYNNQNETSLHGNQSAIPAVDKNQFAETVVDLLLDLLEKANLSRTVSVIHNDTELTELVEQDETDSKVTPVHLVHP